MADRRHIQHEAARQRDIICIWEAVDGRLFALARAAC